MAGWNPTARPEALPKVGGPQGNPGGSPGGTPGGPNASTSVKGWAGKNRTTLLAAGAGGVVLLALVMKSRGGASTDESAAAAGTMTTNPNPQNLAAYDSSSSDVYNAIQPQLEQLQDLFNEWKTGKDAGTTVPVTAAPVTTPTTVVPVPSPTPVTVPYAPSPVPADVALSPVGTALWNQGIAPPADRGATNTQAQADYGKAYEAAWEAKYGLKK